MLFIIQHQVSELWMKLLIHELKAAIAHVRADALEPRLQDPRARQAHPEAAVRAVGGARDADAVRVRRVPARRSAARPASSPRSTARSSSCSATSTPAMLDVFRHDPAAHAELDALLHAPSLYDEFLRHLARRGLPVPRERVERDFTQPYERHPDLVAGVQDDLRRTRSSGGTPTTCARSWSTSRRASSSGASGT